jgi:hypothetical protein
MAEAVNVGKLVVTISGDSKELEAAAKRAGKSVQDISRDVQTAARRVVVSFADMARSMVPVVTAAALATAAVKAFFAALQNTTSLDHLSQATGISIERPSQLRNIALATGTDFEVLGRAAAQFGTRMAEALASPTSRGSQAMRALGIDVRDAAGNIRQLDDLLPALADRFSQFGDGSNKAAIAAALLGEEAGPKMVALLNRGRDALDELRAKLGTTFTTADAQKVRDYNQSMGNLQVAFEKLVKEIAIAATPAIEFLANRLTGAARGLEALNAASVRATERLHQNERAYTVETDRLRALKQEYDELLRRYRAGEGDTERLRRAIKTAAEMFNEQNARVKALARSLLDYHTIIKAIDATAAAVDFAPKKQPPALDPYALERQQVILQQLQERLIGTRDILDEVNFSWQAHGQLVQQTLDQIDKAHEQNFRREAARQQLQRQLRLQEQEGILQTASAAAAAITAIWPKQKGAAIASALINTGVAVTRALIGPPGPPWSFAIAALTAAQGLAQVAAIRSTNEDGSGGTAPVAGSTAATPPEPQQAPPGRSLMIQGIDPAQFYSGKQLEELIRNISTEVQNGATLISTRNLPI